MLRFCRTIALQHLWWQRLDTGRQLHDATQLDPAILKAPVGASSAPPTLSFGRGIRSSHADCAGSIRIGPHVVLGEYVSVGDDSFIGPNCVREGSRIGAHCSVGNHSDIQTKVRLDDYVCLHSSVHLSAGARGIGARFFGKMSRLRWAREHRPERAQGQQRIRIFATFRKETCYIVTKPACVAITSPFAVSRMMRPLLRTMSQTSWSVRMRYFGAYSNKTRGVRKKAESLEQPLGPSGEVAEPRAPPAVRKSWARLLAAVIRIPSSARGAGVRCGSLGPSTTL